MSDLPATPFGALPMPEGFSPEEAANLPDLARRNPERCMMFVDEAMKIVTRDVRNKWLAQAGMLYFVAEKELWRHHPAGFSSIFEWAVQPEIDIKASPACDMLAIMRYAPMVQEECDRDLLELIREVGHSNIRQLIPLIRRTERDGTMKEVLTPYLDEVKGSSFRDILKMVSPEGRRLVWDPMVIYEEIEVEGEPRYRLTFDELTFDELELLAGKTSAKRWYDADRRRIEPPLNVPMLGAGNE